MQARALKLCTPFSAGSQMTLNVAKMRSLEFRASLNEPCKL